MSDEVKGNTAVHGDHDRVAMLSLRANGTPDQTPGVEMIGDREYAENATREQFRQQAASAAQAAGPVVDDLPPQDVEDPEIQERKDRNEKAVEAADKAAESTVAALFTEPEQAETKPAEKPAEKPAADTGPKPGQGKTSTTGTPK